jgi:hypothetical protein
MIKIALGSVLIALLLSPIIHTSVILYWVLCGVFGGVYGYVGSNLGWFNDSY